jgi:hypothetical protein
MVPSLPQTLLSTISQGTLLSGVVEGNQVVFVSTLGGCYIVDLKSGGARMVSCAYYEKILGSKGAAARRARDINLLAYMASAIYSSLPFFLNGNASFSDNKEWRCKLITFG